MVPRPRVCPARIDAGQRRCRSGPPGAGRSRAPRRPSCHRRSPRVAEHDEVTRPAGDLDVAGGPGEHLVSWPGVDHTVGIHSALDCAFASVPQPVELAWGVGVAVHREPTPRLHRLPQEALGGIQSIRTTVDLHRLVQLGAGCEDHRRVEVAGWAGVAGAMSGISVTGQANPGGGHLPARAVTEDVQMGVLPPPAAFVGSSSLGRPVVRYGQNPPRRPTRRVALHPGRVSRPEGCPPRCRSGSGSPPAWIR